jgi:phosphatidylglycerophosphate synthase
MQSCFEIERPTVRPLARKPAHMLGTAESRRPLKTRERAWPRRVAHIVVRLGLTPNQVSGASIALALLGAAAFAAVPGAAPTGRLLLLLAAAICIQLRLLCNLLDGLMAVEEGKHTPSGALYNELPDRLADSLFLAAAGYAAEWPELGWISALLAVGTAYVRAFGASLGFGQDYSGPMAKQQRMFVLTAGCIVALVLPHRPVLAAALAIIALGSALTVWLRIRRLAGHLATGDRV